MTAANSCIVLSEALAPPAIAPELLKQLPIYAPNLVRYLDQGQSQFITTQVEQNLCTALEWWLIEQAQFTSSTAKHNAALALLLAAQAEKTPDSASTEPFWLVELIHMAPSRDGAALIPAHVLQINPDHSQTLLEAAQTLCEGTSFSLHPWSTTHWELRSQNKLAPLFASSQLVSRTSVNDWWDQEPRNKEWRRFVNELQMLYFNHPVNNQRQAQGLLPVNSLWPVGGLAPALWQPQPRPLKQISALTSAYLSQDWGLWLHQLQELDTQLLPFLKQNPEIVLSNTEQLLIIRPRTARIWHRFIKPTPTWRTHWLAQS